MKDTKEKAEILPMDILSGAFQLMREYVLEKRTVYSIKIGVNIDEYFSIDVQLNRFQSSLKHYFWFIDKHGENQRKWKEIKEYIESSTDRKETAKERIERLYKK